MLKKFSRKINRAVSSFLAAVMTMTVFAAVPAMAQTGITTYNYDGYKVEYNVQNEWTGFQNIDVRITNTGTEPILNWALGYDAGGEILGVYNGTILSGDGTEYVIKNAGHNYEIAPNASANFGYTLKTDTPALPEKFENLAKRVDISEGFDVQLRVDYAWNTGFNGFIVLTNTSDAPLEAWTFAFDTNFAINDLWNGRILERADGHYKIASQMWSNPINPGASLEIGLSGLFNDGITPEISNEIMSVVAIGEKEDEPEDPDPIEITLTATADYSAETGMITVNWETTEPEGIFEILVSYDEENFNVAGTVESALTYSFTPEEFELLYVKVKQTLGEITAESEACPVVNTTIEEIILTATADYDTETGLVTVNWETTEPEGIFEILVSYDEENFNVAGTVENALTYSFTPEEFELLYVKVKQTSGERTAESEVCPVVNTTEEIDWDDPTDTDEDGIPDVYETYVYETDPNNPDTDGDGLPDGYEATALGTDPAKADSDDNGISDGNEDFDSDGLSNREEYSHETDPLNEDSDFDGLSDSVEISHNTDPNNSDSDGDSVIDGDEVELGLDPNSSNTNGVPDNEYTVEQTVGAESEAFDRINDSDNPFTVSLDIKAAGMAENNLYATESGYSNTVSNPAIIGMVPEFIYSEGLKVDEVTVSFNLENSVVSNTLGTYTANPEFEGIKRLNVFKFFEEVNMLLPVETFHDIENNRVYANTDELGTYCLIDMELFLDNLGIEPDSAPEPQPAPLPMGRMASVAPMGANLDTNAPVDIIFISYFNPEMADVVKPKIIEASKKILETQKNVRIHYVVPIEHVDATIMNFSDGFSYAYAQTVDGNHKRTSDEELTTVINRIPSVPMNSTAQLSFRLSTTLNYMLQNVVPNLQAGSYRQCFVIDGITSPYLTNAQAAVNNIKTQNINLNFISYPGNPLNNDYKSYATNESLYVDTRFNFTQFVLDFFDDPVGYEYPTIIATGYKFVELDAPITYNYYMANKGEISGSGFANSDTDELKDYQEIMYESTHKIFLWQQTEQLLDWTDDGKVILPKFVDLMRTSGIQLFGVQSGFDRFIGSPEIEILQETRVLPIVSDPMSKDGDGDSFSDDYEIGISGLNPLKYDDTVISDNIIDDSLYFSDNFVAPTDSDKNQLCNGEIKTKSLDGSQQSKYYLSFDREYNSVANTYYLKPSENSDYLLNVSPGHKLKITSANTPRIIEIEALKVNVNSYLYALEGGKEYKIYVTAQSSNAGRYTLTVEQDNWVYAPNGGIRRTTFQHRTTNEIFFTNETIYSIIVDKMRNNYGEDYSSNDVFEFLDKTYEQLTNITKDQTVKMIIDAFNLGYKNENEVIAAIGNVTTPAAIILLFIPGTEIVGGLITLASGGMLWASLINDKHVDKLCEALVDGRYNIQVIHDRYTFNDKPPRKTDRIDFRAWNDCRHINKYYSIFRYEVVPFSNDYKIVKILDDMWELV